MATQLNIKDPVLIERVRELAKHKGQPVTTTLRALVDKEWEARELDREPILAENQRWLAEWQARIAADMPPELRGLSSKEIMDSLYDEDELDGFAR